MIGSNSMHVESEAVQPPDTLTVREETAADVAKEMPFDEFTEYFGVKELATLRTIGGTKSEDSTFVFSAIESRYKSNLERLSQITVSGRARGVIPKNPMTPKKKTIMI